MEEAKNKKVKEFYANKFATCMFLLFLLVFGGGYFYGTRSLNLDSLLFAVKQVLTPAVIMGGFGYVIGKLCDSAMRHPSKNKKNRIKY